MTGEGGGIVKLATLWRQVRVALGCTIPIENASLVYGNAPISHAQDEP